MNKKAMETLDRCIGNLVETDLKLCSEGLEEEKSENPLVERLKVAQKMLKSKDDSASVGHWIGILYAATAIYTVTLHTSKH